MSGFVVRRDAPAMGFDDRAADGQTHAHAVWLGREEAVEQAVEVLRDDSRAAVLDGAAQCHGMRHGGPDGDPALCASRLLHGLYGVDDEVDNHLLELDAVSQHLRHSRSEVARYRDAARLDFVMEKHKSSINEFVKRRERMFGRSPNRHPANAADNVCGTTCIGNDARVRFAHLRYVGHRPVESAQPGFAIRSDSGERLVQLVGNRGSQLAQHRDARGVRKVRLQSLQHFLRANAFGQVDQTDQTDA